MGMLDGILSQVVGSTMGGGQSNSPLGSILGNLSASLGGGGGALGGAGGGLGGLAGLARGAMGGTNNSASGALAGGAILAAVMTLLQSQGGLNGVLAKLRSSGLGEHADSWLGAGANRPVSADDLHKALGGGAIGGLASQLGINTQQAGGVLSQVLPELVNQMSPQGALPDNHDDMLSKGLEMLRGLSR
jgi:uncharacterized protein YidB (DUF937 family)